MDNGEMWSCRLRGNMRIKGIKSTNPVSVGDHVEVLPEEGAELKGVIQDIEERRNYIIRRSVNLSKRTQVIAANIDQAVLVVTLREPQTLLGFIDRFLVTAEAYDIPTVIVLNKMDLYGEDMEDELLIFKATYYMAGYEILETSTETGQGMDDFQSLLKDKVSLISGNSGVGKSTLINKVDPDLDLKTQEISEAHAQGQHTTTFAEMHLLSIGGYIIDTPGIRGFGLVKMEEEEIGDYFPEIFKFKSDCRFNNCLHLEEPKCAVRDAVEEGQIAWTRYRNYVQMVTEEEDTYRTDDFAE
jgi:ribosome biogenesis GTPase